MRTQNDCIKDISDSVKIYTESIERGPSICLPTHNLYTASLPGKGDPINDPNNFLLLVISSLDLVAARTSAGPSAVSGAAAVAVLQVVASALPGVLPLVALLSGLLVVRVPAVLVSRVPNGLPELSLDAPAWPNATPGKLGETGLKLKLVLMGLDTVGVMLGGGVPAALLRGALGVGGSGIVWGVIMVSACACMEKSAWGRWAVNVWAWGAREGAASWLLPLISTAGAGAGAGFDDLSNVSTGSLVADTSVWDPKMSSNSPLHFACIDSAVSDPAAGCWPPDAAGMLLTTAEAECAACIDAATSPAVPSPPLELKLGARKVSDSKPKVSAALKLPSSTSFLVSVASTAVVSPVCPGAAGTRACIRSAASSASSPALAFIASLNCSCSWSA